MEDQGFGTHQHIVRAIERDPLAPFVVIACEDARLLSRLSSPELQLAPAGDTAASIRRHLRILGIAPLLDGLDSRGFRTKISRLLDVAYARVESDKTSPNLLTRYLHSRRSRLVEEVLSTAPPSAKARQTWTEIRSDPALSFAFDQHMIRRSTSELVPNRRAGMPPLIADIGGGPGHYAIQILRACPSNWTAILVDCYDETGWLINEVSPALRNRFRIVRDLSENCIPAGAGVYLLGSLLHNLDDTGADRLLRGCTDVADSRSEVIVIERTWDPTKLGDSSRDIDMNILFGGRERTDRELGTLIIRGGLKLAKTTVTRDRYRVLYCIKGESE